MPKNKKKLIFDSGKANIVALVCRKTLFTAGMSAELDGSYSEAARGKEGCFPSPITHFENFLKGEENPSPFLSPPPCRMKHSKFEFLDF